MANESRRARDGNEGDLCSGAHRGIHVYGRKPIKDFFIAQESIMEACEARQSNGRADWQVAIKCLSKMMKQGMNMLGFGRFSEHSRTAISRTKWMKFKFTFSITFCVARELDFIQHPHCNSRVGDVYEPAEGKGCPFLLVRKCVRKRERRNIERMWMKRFAAVEQKVRKIFLEFGFIEESCIRES